MPGTRRGGAGRRGHVAAPATLVVAALALAVAALFVVSVHEPFEGRAGTIAHAQEAEEAAAEPGPVVVTASPSDDGWVGVAVHAGVLCLLCLYLAMLVVAGRWLRRPAARRPYEHVGHTGLLGPPPLAARPAPDLAALSISRT